MKFITVLFTLLTFIPGLYLQSRQIIKREGSFANEFFNDGTIVMGNDYSNRQGVSIYFIKTN